MKVKMIREFTPIRLEDAVNDFIKNVRVLDMKFDIESQRSGFTEYCVLIMYEEYVYKRGE